MHDQSHDITTFKTKGWEERRGRKEKLKQYKDHRTPISSYQKYYQRALFSISNLMQILVMFPGL